jgi:hypothetical protein
MIHTTDWEHEAQKDLVYLQEDMHAFYSSLNDPGKAQVETFLSSKGDVFDLKAIEVLQENAKMNHSIPPNIIVKGDRRLLQYYERKVNTISF